MGDYKRGKSFVVPCAFIVRNNRMVSNMSLKPVIDLDKEYGIVLEGGGAKGAYQVGAWKALKEAGIKIQGIAGTSVGALNGAMMCMDELEQAEKLWSELTYSKVMDVDDEKMRQLMDLEMPFSQMLEHAKEVIDERGVDVTPLKNMIEEYVDEEKIRNSSRNFYVKTLRVDDIKELDVDMKKVEPGLMKDFLLASSYLFPLFKMERLHEKIYLDGGVVDNIPIGSLVQRNYEDIIVIRIFGMGRTKKVKIPEGTKVHFIEPRVDLGNIIDFDAKKSIRNMKIGYYDAKRMLYDLKGRIYYIEENEKECYYLKHLLQISERKLECFMVQYRIVGGSEQWMRGMCEIVLPTLAAELKLSRDWNYKELYLSILEATAKLCRVPKYQIYTLEQLEKVVRQKMEDISWEEKSDFPLFTMYFEKEEELL